VTPRRYCLSKRRAASLSGRDAAAAAWQAKQEAEPGTPLPSTFPFRTRLAELGYVAREDLDGADEQELNRAGLGLRQARAVLTAWSALS
jgi:hypothetical protein